MVKIERACRVGATALLLSVGCSSVPVSGPVPGSTSTSTSPVAMVKLCEELRSFLAAMATHNLGSSGSELARGLFAEIESLLVRAGRSAPEELAGDLDLVAGAVSRYRAALEGTGYDPAVVPPDALAELNSPEVAMALERVTRAAQVSCGLPG